MNKLTWVMLIAACVLIGWKVTRAIAPSTASSSPIYGSQKRSEMQQGRVIAILHSATKDATIVGPRLVHEGDTIGDVKVVKIEKSRVHFQKQDIQWSQTPQDPPAKHWQ